MDRCLQAVWRSVKPLVKWRRCWRRRRRRQRRSDGSRHACEFELGSESQLARLPPNAALRSRLKRRLQKVLLVSSTHPFTRYYLRSKASIAFEKQRHGISSNWWVVHPCSKFRLSWDVVMALTYIYAFFAMPYTISFRRLASKSVRSAYLGPVYVCCLLDVLLNLVTGYLSLDGPNVVMEPVHIVKHYAKGFLLIDLASSMPYEWLYEARLTLPRQSIQWHLLLFELVPLLKLSRLVTLRIYAKEILVVVGASRARESVICLLGLTAFILHWAACFTHMFPFYYAYVWNIDVQKSANYLFMAELYDKPAWLVYLKNLHMGAGNLCGYTYSEVQFDHLPDKIVRCMLLLLGMIYFLYVIVIVLQLSSSSTEPEHKYQMIMRGVKEYTRNKRLPEQLKNRLLHFYEHRFQGSLFKEHAITSALSKHLRNEVTQHNSRKLIEATSLFNNIPRNLLNSMIGALKQMIFLRNDVVYKWGSEASCMYFVVTGSVAVLTFSGVEVCHIQDGDYFGEVALLLSPDNKRSVTVVALEVCEVLRLDARDFNRLVLPKSELYERLRSVALDRIRAIQEAELRSANEPPASPPS
ncbi:hypothetical protein TKK_0014886 [Trichogramma kaykai]|uniref:Cyclic nucleotide-binding domain-containing protein n=1 Tax=Trichogramma kaykai TaxID=54128 RepID=A0ABD2WBZ9_9HYME